MTTPFIQRYFVSTPPGASTLKSSPHGYCVAPDGTIYALTQAFWHGVLLVCLNPELAAKHGFKVPESEQDVLEFVCVSSDDTTWVRSGVFAYQDFELTFGRQLPMIRVGCSPFIGMAVDRGCVPATSEQTAALRLIFADHDMDAKSTVVTPVGDLKLPKVWDYLADMDYAPSPQENAFDDY